MASSKPITNPFSGHDEYHCFGCDPGNPAGLKLRFELRGDEVTATWTPRKDYEGYPGVVHGGIQATLIDEIAGWYLLAVLGVVGVTRELHVKYLRPARIEDGPFTLRASGAGKTARRTARVNAVLENASGIVCAEAEGEFAVFSEGVSRDRFGFPGKSALFPEN